MPLELHDTGIVLMAAGASRRLGQPKQLIETNGKSLLTDMAEVALATGMRPVIVVLGALAEAVKATIQHKEVTLVQNPHWQKGMATSLHIGLRTLLHANPSLQAAILMVCDQPFVSTRLLLQLLQSHTATGMPAIASTYAGQMGTPALFHRSIFEDLMQIQGDTGARKWMAAHPESVATLPFEKGAFDIDTPEDLAQWQNPSNPDLS